MQTKKKITYNWLFREFFSFSVHSLIKIYFYQILGNNKLDKDNYKYEYEYINLIYNESQNQDNMNI